MAANSVWIPLLIIGYCVSQINGDTDCKGNDDCENHRLCTNGKCIDPCLEGVCGSNTLCHVSDHVALCACQLDYAGHPFTGCFPGPPGGSCNCPTVVQPNVTSTRPSPPALYTPTKNKKEYHIYTNVQMNWFQALAYCHTQGMRMATIDNKAEYEEFVAAVKDAQIGQIDVWLGGADLGQDGVYIWMSTGKPVRYFDWNAGEPNRVNRGGVLEHCMMLGGGWGYKYNDQTCKFQSYAACEF